MKRLGLLNFNQDCYNWFNMIFQVKPHTKRASSGKVTLLAAKGFFLTLTVTCSVSFETIGPCTFVIALSAFKLLLSADSVDFSVSVETFRLLIFHITFFAVESFFLAVGQHVIP